MNKKSRVAQMKHKRRKETLKERARAAKPAGIKAAAPARTKYEMEEAAPVKAAAKPKVAALKAQAEKPAAKPASEAKVKAEVKTPEAAPAAEAKLRAHKPKVEATAEEKPKAGKPVAAKATKEE